jgi:hypothetical protein
MASDLLQTILRYVLLAVTNLSVKELFLHLRRWLQKHSAHARSHQFKPHKVRRVTASHRMARFTLHVFSNGNPGCSVVSSERMLSKPQHRLPSEGEAICLWSGMLVETVLSFMVLGLSSSPHFLVDAHLQLLSFAAIGLSL